MAGGVQYFQFALPDLHRVPRFQTDALFGNLPHCIMVSEHFCAGGFNQRGVAGDVVMVFMGVDDLFYRPTFFFRDT